MVWRAANSRQYQPSTLRQTFHARDSKPPLKRSSSQAATLRKMTARALPTSSKIIQLACATRQSHKQLWPPPMCAIRHHQCQLLGTLRVAAQRVDGALARAAHAMWFKKCSRRDSDLSSTQECPLGGKCSSSYSVGA